MDLFSNAPSGSTDSAAWVAAGRLVNSDGRVQSLRIRFVVASINSDEFPPSCLHAPNKNPVESSVVLSVVLMNPYHTSSENPTNDVVSTNSPIKIISIIMKASNGSADLSSEDYGSTADEYQHHHLSKCVWFDESLSRWTPSGCATFDTRRHSFRSHHVMSGINAPQQPLLLCECTHLTEFAVVMFHTSNNDINK